MNKDIKLCEISMPIEELLPEEDTIKIPVWDIKWMTDEEWVELAASEENQRLLKKHGWVKDENGHWHPPEERTEG